MCFRRSVKQTKLGQGHNEIASADVRLVYMSFVPLLICSLKFSSSSPLITAVITFVNVFARAVFILSAVADGGLCGP